MIKQTIDLNHMLSNKIINLHHYVMIPLTCKVKQTTEVESKANKVLSSITATATTKKMLLRALQSRKSQMLMLR